MRARFETSASGLDFWPLASGWGRPMSVRDFRSVPHPFSFPNHPFPGPQGTTFLNAPNSHLSSSASLPNSPFPVPQSPGIGGLLGYCSFSPIPVGSKSRKEGLPDTKLKMWGLCPRSLVPRDPPNTLPPAPKKKKIDRY